MRLADTEAEIATEEDKIERAARRAERMHREHEAGRIGAFDIMRALGDSDEGDKDRVRVLERRRDSLQRQIREASEAMTPPEARARNAVEEAASRASRILAEVTSQRQAEDQAALAARAQLQRERSSFYTSRGRRPFASRSGAAVECADCRECGLGPEESAAVHAEMDAQKAAEEADRAAYAPGSVITTGYEPGIAYR